MSDGHCATGYIGRFAPSPTGPLHFGSAVAAVASFLQARAQAGLWHIRIEDIDPPREQAGAGAAILDALEALGLEWDGPVTFQSRRSGAYDEALAQLDAAALTFPCACTRKQLAGGRYPGTCRTGVAPGRFGRSVRLRVEAGELRFEDDVQGEYRQDLGDEVGDFVVRRADGLYSYHLAVVVDDAAAGVTEIVRGVDLIESTPRQIYLQTALGLETPAYAHFPVVLNAAGTKLSKQTFAKPIDVGAPSKVLFETLCFLRQEPPRVLLDARPEEIIEWAIAHWDLRAVGRLSHAHSVSGRDAGLGSGL